jgi:hypothetical protein
MRPVTQDPDRLQLPQLDDPLTTEYIPNDGDKKDTYENMVALIGAINRNIERMQAYCDDDGKLQSYDKLVRLVKVYKQENGSTNPRSDIIRSTIRQINNTAQELNRILTQETQETQETPGTKRGFFRNLFGQGGSGKKRKTRRRSQKTRRRSRKTRRRARKTKKRRSSKRRNYR